MAQAAPGSDDAKRELALFAYRTNRRGEAIELLRKLDPDRGLMKHWGSYWGFLSIPYHMLGDYEGELEALRQGRRRYPGPYMVFREARALAALDRLDDLAAIVDTIRSLTPQELLGYRLGLVAGELRAHGHRDVASEILEESIAWYESRTLRR